MRPRRKHVAKRVAILAGIVVVAVCIALLGILEIRDYRARKPFITAGPSMILGPDNLPGPETFAPDEAAVRMPPITDFRTLPSSAVSDEVKGEELVIGIVLDGQVRAYPLNMMTGPQREVFNDQLAGHSIAATW